MIGKTRLLSVVVSEFGEKGLAGNAPFYYDNKRCRHDRIIASTHPINSGSVVRRRCFAHHHCHRRGCSLPCDGGSYSSE